MTRLLILAVYLLLFPVLQWMGEEPIRVTQTEPRATSWTFGRPACTSTMMVSASTWDVFEAFKPHAVTWTVWSNSGGTVSKGIE